MGAGTTCCAGGAGGGGAARLVLGRPAWMATLLWHPVESGEQRQCLRDLLPTFLLPSGEALGSAPRPTPPAVGPGPPELGVHSVARSGWGHGAWHGKQPRSSASAALQLPVPSFSCPRPHRRGGCEASFRFWSPCGQARAQLPWRAEVPFKTQTTTVFIDF